jgi:hypothetical protein
MPKAIPPEAWWHAFKILLFLVLLEAVALVFVTNSTTRPA